MTNAELSLKLLRRKKHPFSLASIALVVISGTMLSAHLSRAWASCSGEIRASLSKVLLDPKSSESERTQLIRKTQLSDEELEEFAEQRYKGRQGAQLLHRLRALGKNYTPLLRDPGVMLRLKEFEAFMHAHPELHALDAWQIREHFSDSLGYKTVYRAMALTKKEYKNIHANGIESGLARNLLDKPPSERDRYFKGYLRQDITDQAHRRTVQVTGASDPLISVTEIPEVALAVAKNYASEGKKVYLFKMKIAALDVLSSDHDEVGMFYKPFGEWIIPGHSLPVRQSDPRVESFIYYKVSPSEITSDQTFHVKDIQELKEI